MNDDEMVTCPYNATHRIARARIQYHLIKCQKNCPSLWICPFNATHRYPEHLRQDHIKSCPSRPHDEPKPRASAATEGTTGAKTTPKPLLQREYLRDNDPESEYWDN